MNKLILGPSQICENLPCYFVRFTLNSLQQKLERSRLKYRYVVYTRGNPIQYKATFPVERRENVNGFAINGTGHLNFITNCYRFLILNLCGVCNTFGLLLVDVLLDLPVFCVYELVFKVCFV